MPARSAQPDNPGPCTLLSQADVEAVLGALEGPPWIRARADGPPRCVYRARDLHAIEVERVVIAPASGSPDGDPPGGAALGCCVWELRHHGVAIRIDVQGSEASLEDAGRLAWRARARIDAPLADPGTAGLPAAAQGDARRPRPAPDCDLLSPRDAASRLGASHLVPIAGDGGTSRCRVEFQSSTTAGLPSPAPLRFTVLWRGGYRAFRGALEDAPAGHALEGGAPAGTPDAFDGPWERAAVGTDRVLAVRRDVLVTVEGEVFLGNKDALRALASMLLEGIR
jgi:hypothetical protein